MIKSLSVSNFRNLTTSIELSPTINLFYGKNGSGKSSILEAIHFISFGRSFRASLAAQMIATGHSSFVINATIFKNNNEYQLGMSKSNRSMQCKINADAASLSKIAALLPALFIDCDSHRNFFTSSSYRRRLFDWLLFHTEPGYIHAMKAYTKALKHRNTLLKQQGNTQPWDQILEAEGGKIHEYRHKAYLKLLKLVSEDGYNLNNLTLSYSPGYDVGIGMLAELNGSRVIDERLGYTSKGPHKADWLLEHNGEKASYILSQGQQKIAYLKLILLHYQCMLDVDIVPVMMMDDVPAELDGEHRDLIHKLLAELPGQTIITAIHKEDLSWKNQTEIISVESL